MRQNLTLLLTFGLVLLNISCINSSERKGKSRIKPVEYIDYTLDKKTPAKEVSLDRLIEGLISLDGQVIQTEGIFYFEFENVSICSHGDSVGKCVWLDLSNNLNFDVSAVQLASGKKFIVKGILDTNSKGHLGSYAATIKNVYYLKEVTKIK